jgi:hypothetical protein
MTLFDADLLTFEQSKAIQDASFLKKKNHSLPGNKKQFDCWGRFYYINIFDEVVCESRNIDDALLCGKRRIRKNQTIIFTITGKCQKTFNNKRIIFYKVKDIQIRWHTFPNRLTKIIYEDRYAINKWEAIRAERQQGKLLQSQRMVKCNE